MHGLACSCPPSMEQCSYVEARGLLAIFSHIRKKSFGWTNPGQRLTHPHGPFVSKRGQECHEQNGIWQSILQTDNQKELTAYARQKTQHPDRPTSIFRRCQVLATKNGLYQRPEVAECNEMQQALTVATKPRQVAPPTTNPPLPTALRRLESQPSNRQACD